MKRYNLQVLINPTLPTSSLTRVVDSIENVVRYHANEVILVDRRGIVELVFPIDKMHKAYSMLIEYTIDEKDQPLVEEKISHPVPSDTILKHLFVDLGVE